MSDGRSPTFVIPGASKSGTTSLHHYLTEHPDIYMPSDKELHFFSREQNYERGIEAYEQHFAGCDGETAVGEASPTYFYHGNVWVESGGELRWLPEDDSAVRISEAYPDIDVLVTLRNPVTRAYSQYWKNVRQGYERTYPFREAIEEELRGERDHKESPFCWVYANRYSTHLEHWLDCFDREQIKFLVFEKWIDRTEETLRDVCEFLGVEPLSDWSHASQVKNPSRTPRNLRLNWLYHDHLKRTGVGELLYYLNLRSGYPDMGPETKRFMLEVFEEEIRATAALIGQDLDLWIEELEPDDTAIV
jgi:hypothetical protein